MAHHDEGEGRQTVERQPSPRNAPQARTAVCITQRVADGEVHVTCRREGREAKHRAIRDKQEARLRADLERLRNRIAMKSPLMERPVWHQLEHPVQTHIVLCVIACHLLVVIEKTVLDRGVQPSWARQVSNSPRIRR